MTCILGNIVDVRSYLFPKLLRRKKRLFSTRKRYTSNLSVWEIIDEEPDADAWVLDSSWFGSGGWESRPPPLYETQTPLLPLPTTPTIPLLPDDVLALIFEMARDLAERDIEDSNAIRTDGKPRLPQIPHLVSLVCSQWRNVAFSYPLLWSHLNISPPWRLETIRFWLEKSQSCPIQLSLRMRIVERHSRKHLVGWDESFVMPERRLHETRDAHKIFRSLFPVLSHHLPRCKRISLDVSQEFSSVIPHFTEKLEKVSTPLVLEELSLQQTFSDRLATQLQPRRIVLLPQSYPRLTNVKIGYPCSVPSHCSITSLHLRATLFTFEEIWDVLPHYPTLKLLALYYDFKDHWSASNVRPCFLPSLVSLQFFNFPHISKLLLAITAPNLRDLVMSRLGHNAMTPFYENQWSRPEKFPKLRTISLTISAGNIRLFSASKCFPSVEEVVIYGNNTLKYLSDFIVLGDEIVWPKLRMLALTGNPFIISSPQGKNVLREVINSREAAEVPLRKVYLLKEDIDRMGPRFLRWMGKHAEVVARDVWSDIQRDGMYHPDCSFI